MAVQRVARLTASARGMSRATRDVLAESGEVVVGPLRLPHEPGPRQVVDDTLARLVKDLARNCAKCGITANGVVPDAWRGP
jgi:hypothetical protein